MKVEELTAKILRENPQMDSYQIAIAVSARMDQLLNGAQSKLNVDMKKMKAADVALMELAEGLVKVKGFVDNQE